MHIPPPNKRTVSKLNRLSFLVQCVIFTLGSVTCASASNLKLDFENQIEGVSSNFPNIENTEGYTAEHLPYADGKWLREQAIEVDNKVLEYSGKSAVISSSPTETEPLHHRTQEIFNFLGETSLDFESLKVIFDQTYNEYTSGGEVNPTIFSVNKDELGGTPDETIITGQRLEVLLKEKGGRFFFVEKGSTLNLDTKDIFLEAKVNDSTGVSFFLIDGYASITSDQLVGIIGPETLGNVDGILLRNGADIDINSSNLVFINQSQTISKGINTYFNSSITLSDRTNLVFKGFEETITLNSSSSLSGSPQSIGIMDTSLGLKIDYGSRVQVDTDKLYIDSSDLAIDSYGDVSVKAMNSYIAGKLSNDGGVFELDFGQNSYFSGQTFNYDFGGGYCGEINLTFGQGSRWDISYDEKDLNSINGMNHLTSLNLTYATVNLASAENTDNFLKVDKLKGTGNFNLLINTDSHKSTEIHSGTDSEGVFNISVELAQGSLDQIGNDGILFATDQSGKVQYQPVSSITDAGLTLSTPELVSEDNSGFTEWYISRINNEEGPTPSAMLDGFQNNYLFWRTLTDSTKERFGQLRHGQSAGVWGRVTAGSLSQGDLTNDYQTYRLGADTSIQPGLSLGAMFEIHEGDLDTSNGKGDMQAITAAIYGLCVSPSGYYADAGFRFGVMDYEYKNTALLYDEYDYNSSAVGAWLEVGKEWAFANNYTLTPHLAINFGRFGTEHFTSDNGLKAKVDSVNSVIFTVGTDVGYKTETFEVSAVADLMTEVAGSQDIRISHNEASLTRSADYSDTWMEFGLSASYRPTDDTLLWVNGRRSAFADLDNDWRINAGVRWSFY